jgi:hypothetical protein
MICRNSNVYMWVVVIRTTNRDSSGYIRPTGQNYIPSERTGHYLERQGPLVCDIDNS